MFKAESNIVTDSGVIKNGETFNPDQFKIASKDIERWISIGLVSRVDSGEDDKPVADAAASESDSSVVDADDRRKHSRKATK